MLQGWCAVCKKPTEMRCQKCKAVYYCSRECQKSAHKEHRLMCFGFQNQDYIITSNMENALCDISCATSPQKILLIIHAPDEMEKRPTVLRLVSQYAAIEFAKQLGVKFDISVLAEGCNEECQDVKAFKWFMKAAAKMGKVHQYWSYVVDVEKEISEMPAQFRNNSGPVTSSSSGAPPRSA